MKSILTLLVFTGVLLTIHHQVTADQKESKSSKEALQSFNDYVGTWKGNGEPGARPAGKDFWSETVNWKWRFKKNDAWLVMDIQNGKHFKGGELRYLPDKDLFELSAVTNDDKKLVFQGTMKDDILILERTDSSKKETQRIKMNLAAEGARFIYRLEHKPAQRTVFYPDFQVACTKEGESLGAEEKKLVCVVTGGQGKIAVSYKGQTYYVCCSGCKDAFEENPEKILKEFEAKKAKK
jgi:YHS domain-containing protein